VSKLLSQTPFHGLSETFEGIFLRELSGFEIVSMAVKSDQIDTLTTEFGGVLPKPGQWIETKIGKILWTGQSQYFYFATGDDAWLDEKLQQQSQDSAYFTLQTDGWAAIEISGSKIHDVLERFIPLDLRSWQIGQGTRTSAHHIGIIVMKTRRDTYQILTPTSSSAALLEALIHVIENVLQSG